LDTDTHTHAHKHALQPADRDFSVAAFGVLLSLSALEYTLAGCGPPTAAVPSSFGTWDMLAALHLVKLMVGLN
jgi:hypothetical protein